MGTNDCCGGVGTVSEEELLRQLDKSLDDYVNKPGGLIPALQHCQNLLGYVPQAAISLISDRLSEPLHKVYGVVTFYSFFSRVPRGKYLIRVCLGTACYVRGAQLVLDALKEHLGIDVGGTTDDRLFSLEGGRCFGACGLAPVIMINDDVHQQVQPADVPGILEQYRLKETGSAA